MRQSLALITLAGSLLAAAPALAEYRYTNYRDNFSRNQLMTGVGFRF